MHTNAVLPAGSQYNALVDGKPTGLAGCNQQFFCPRSERCLRSDARLPYRALMAITGVADCQAFIPATSEVAQ